MKIAPNTNGDFDKLTTLTALTNLLAFNTKMEAAQIGQEGKGFATVADELREIFHKTNQSFSRPEFIGQRKPTLDPDEIDMAIHDQLDAMQDLNSSMSSITQLAAEITQSHGRKSLPRKELNHLYELLGRNFGKDIA